ncbi:unknown protein [Microcystis aeruginosa NIES-843]|uniref:Uncharacterized protein n=1 Tax=Microcystis aeruginosa (strain NIES-843 / IAM M-2473) TaxID=449447 RepID=B0JK07_MICAN|nr:unknown protein [Microcystis aeruginosa NIES-843]
MISFSVRIRSKDSSRGITVRNFLPQTLIRVCGKKLFLGTGCGVWGVGCGVWGFIDFQVVNYLIFWEKVQEFSPRSPQWLALFEGKKVQKSYPTRFLDLFSRP